MPVERAKLPPMAGRAGAHRRRLVALGAAGITAALVAIVVVSSPLDAAIATTTTLTGPSQAVFGETVAFTASVECGAGTATGTVSFVEDAREWGTTLGPQGVASVEVSDLATGTHVVTAFYEGDGNCEASASSPLTIEVSKAPTSITFSTPNPSLSHLGEGFFLPVTVGAANPGSGTPTGSVRLHDGGVPVATQALENGGATLSMPTDSLGTRTITVTYDGDDNFAPSSGGLTLDVVPVDPGCSATFGGYVCANSSRPSSALPATGRTKDVSFRESGSELPNTGLRTTTLLFLALGTLVAGCLCIATGFQKLRAPVRRGQ
jgi:hypothetical protein